MTTTLHLPIQLPDLIQAIVRLPLTEQQQIFRYLQAQIALSEIEAKLNTDIPNPQVFQIHSITTHDGTPWAVLSLPALHYFTQIPLGNGESEVVVPSLPQESATELLSVLSSVKQEMLAEHWEKASALGGDEEN